MVSAVDSRAVSGRTFVWWIDINNVSCHSQNPHGMITHEPGNAKRTRAASAEARIASTTVSLHRGSLQVRRSQNKPAMRPECVANHRRSARLDQAPATAAGNARAAATVAGQFSRTVRRPSGAAVGYLPPDDSQ